MRAPISCTEVVAASTFSARECSPVSTTTDSSGKSLQSVRVSFHRTIC